MHYNFRRKIYSFENWVTNLLCFPNPNMVILTIYGKWEIKNKGQNFATWAVFQVFSQARQKGIGDQSVIWEYVWNWNFFSKICNQWKYIKMEIKFKKPYRFNMCLLCFYRFSELLEAVLGDFLLTAHATSVVSVGPFPFSLRIVKTKVSPRK